MKKNVLLLALFIMSLSSAFGQTEADSIAINKVFGGYQYSLRGLPLTMNQLRMSLQSNEEAQAQLKSAQSSYVLTMVFSYAGGFMVGYPIGTAIGGGDPNWKVAAIGLGLIAVAIPISRNFSTKTNQAVKTYNEGLTTTSSRTKKELKMTMTENGIGLRLSL